jgi:hypothetical protein
MKGCPAISELCTVTFAYKYLFLSTMIQVYPTATYLVTVVSLRMTEDDTLPGSS